MNIGLVCYPTYGGSGVVATELGKALAHKGHKVHFITYKQPFKLDPNGKNLFFHEVGASDYALFDYPPYELSLTNAIVDVARFEQLDLLHVHYAIPHASAAYLARKILKDQGINLPFITTLHGTDITLVGKDPSYKEVITFAMNRSNALTTVSRSLKEDTLRHFRITKEIDVVSNFICLSDYPEAPDEGLKKYYAPGGEHILMHISNFRKVKRVEDIVRVFQKVRERMPSKLLLVGDGPERHNVEILCRRLGVCDDIRILGKMKNTEALLSIADIFLLTSESESFGLAALEAMAAFTPVISTNTGGLPEVNIHGETGFLSDVGDIADMASNCLTLLQDPGRLETLKSRARNHAKKFDISKILPLYEEVYERVIYGKKELT